MAENAPSQRHSLSALDALFSTWGGQVAGLLDFLDDVLAWVKDRQGRYAWVNHAFLANYASPKTRPRSTPAKHWARPSIVDVALPCGSARLAASTTQNSL